MYERCVIKKKRTKSTEKSVLIRNASDLLESGSISVSDFLTSIANLKENKNRITTTTTNKRAQMESTDDDSDGDTASSSASTHSQQTTVSRCVNKYGGEAKRALFTEIHEKIENGLAFTTDLWTDNYKRISYLVIAAHFVDKKINSTTGVLQDQILCLVPLSVYE